MCTILLAWRHVPGAPVLLAANRDELVARPSAPPQTLSEHPLIAGGRDLLAGGTWLAVRADGAVGAVTNRRSEGRDPQRRSRGELPLAILGAGDAASGRELMAALGPRDHNPCNALLVTADLAVVAHVDDAARGPRLVDLEPGLHVLTVVDLDDGEDVKVAALRRRFEAALAGVHDATGALLGMEEVLRDHGDATRTGVAAACIHGDVYGTVSSSSVAVDSAGRITYRHAAGRPCTTPHRDVSALLAR